MLRPGRLEVHLEVPPPSLGGRRQILDIHTAPMRRAGLLGEGHRWPILREELARRTAGFTGAELAAVVRAAASSAATRHLAGSSAELEVSPEDLMEALNDVEPRSRARRPALEHVLRSLGLDQYSEALRNHHIGFEELRHISDAQLREAGVASVGHRIRLLAFAREQM